MPRSRRRKQSNDTQKSPGKRSRPSLDLGWRAQELHDDEHIDSGSEDNDGQDSPAVEPSLESDEEKEPLEVRKVRLAREYLQKIDEKADDDSTSSSSDEEDSGGDDRLGRKLQRQRQKKEGTFERLVADKVLQSVQSLDSLSEGDTRSAFSSWQSEGRISLLRGHELTPTCVDLSGTDRAVSGSKDHSVILWDLQTEKRITYVCDSWKKAKSSKHLRTPGQVLSISCSDDGRYAAVGRHEGTVQIYDIRAKSKFNLVKTFEGHKGPVNCLAFRSQSLQLFSGSSDRCIRHYNLEEMLYLETLYGHQFAVMDIDCHRKERPVSVGLDRTARSWKLTEDSHLIYRGGAKVQSADCVNVIKDDWFLTGHQDGNISLWAANKKRAVASVVSAHGETKAGVSRGIVSISSLRMSDLALTGSNDGFLRLWRVHTGRTLEERGLHELCKVPVVGYVNSIVVSPKAEFCVLAAGQEHRLGRWDRVPGAKNRLVVVKLRGLTENEDQSDEESVTSVGAEESASSSSDSDE